MCGIILIEKNPGNKYGTGEGMNYFSSHHLFPVRLAQYFTKQEVKNVFQINNSSEAAELCYECHEEVLHNIVLNKGMINNLGKLLKDKSKKDRIKLLHVFLKKGIEIYLKEKPDLL